MIQFLVGLILVSQLFAGAKDCNTRRDECEKAPNSAYEAQTFDAVYKNKKTFS